MKKYIVLSVNWNPDYLYYLPLCVWAWRKFGWEPIVFYHPKGTGHDPLLSKATIGSEPIRKYLHDKGSVNFDGYRSDTITQVSRLYGACAVDGENYLMTGDIDMIPLSDYWKPDENEITIYGHDLTGYGNYPICYIGMKSSRWIEVMGLGTDYNELIKRDLSGIPKASSGRWEDYWETDQDLITKRLNDTQFKKTFITRGQLPNGYARGRVDRGAWSLDHEEFIDAHLLRDCYKLSDTGAGNLAKTMRLLEKIWPNEDFTWFREYTKEFQKLANNG